LLSQVPLAKTSLREAGKATQNPAQHLHVSARTGSQDTSPADEKTLVLPVHAPECENLQGRGVGDTELEAVKVNLGVYSLGGLSVML
jgi:hypothetical protein